MENEICPFLDRENGIYCTGTGIYPLGKEINNFENGNGIPSL